MKHVTLLFYFLFLVCQSDGQIPVWNLHLPVIPGVPSQLGSLQYRGDHFLLHSQKRFIEVDQFGTITSIAKGSYPAFLYSRSQFICEKKDRETGQFYFLVGYRNNYPSSDSNLIIGEYHPDLGFLNETVLTEQKNSILPLIFALNDSVFYTLSKKYYRRITHHKNHTIEINWEQSNLMGEPIHGVLTNNGVVAIASSGRIFALDSLGNNLWDNSAPYGLSHIQKAENGFVACSRYLSNELIIVRFSDTGVVLWSKNFSDRFHNSLLVEPDGSITVTGQSDSLAVLLQHLDQDGNTIWRKTYQQGTGDALLHTSDGGYLIAGSANNLYLVIKTDGFGNTGSVKKQPPPEKRNIENTLLSAVFYPSATLFSDYPRSNFFVPKEDLTTIFYAAAPWIGGLDQEDALHLAVATYPNYYEADYRSGLAQEQSTDLNRVWAITRSYIEKLQEDWSEDGLINQAVPYDILTWPAKGNLDFKYNLDFTDVSINRDLLPAPFVDVNADGKYSIYDGDYPSIKGDQMAWWIITDSMRHTQSDALPFILDMSISAYTYDCSQNEKLNSSLFVDFNVINRSNNTYKDMYAGLWADADLGCAYDDYIASLPTANAFYVYNRDAVDGLLGSTCPDDIPTFGSSIPVGSVSFTNVALNKFIYYNNSASTPPPLPGTSDPVTAEEYNYYLQGRALDGSIPTHNGQPIDFSFPDNPADPMGNSMCASNLPAGDRRILGSHGPFNFAPNDTFQLSVAFTYHPDIPHPCPDIFGTVKNDLAELHNLINSGALAAPANLPPTAQLTSGQSILLDATIPGATNYFWSNGATTATISVVQAGVYNVTITRSTGCTSLETVLVTAATPTHEADWLDDLRIFPNPNAGQFNVELRGAAQKSLECTLYNSLGQLIHRQIVDFQSGVLNQTFHYTRLPSGIYTLCLKSGEKMRYVKVILQH